MRKTSVRSIAAALLIIGLVAVTPLVFGQQGGCREICGEGRWNQAQMECVINEEPINCGGCWEICRDCV